MRLTKEDREFIQRTLDLLPTTWTETRRSLKKFLAQRIAKGFVYGGDNADVRTHGKSSAMTRVQLTSPGIRTAYWRLDSEPGVCDASLLTTEGLREVANLMLEAADAWEEENKQ